MRDARNSIELVREGRYIAEVEVVLIYSDESWSPTMSLDDARKVERARFALRAGDLSAAAKYGRVYELTPLTA